MSKAYSNKALPAGTILREWRLEEVLGVGGFGIVYKGRGIYFNELVAIKEYFPSSISERDEEDTVVPIDSDAEEVHALGLKKFVEEAKLLWNLSTPTRHPNIVNVRSLFEIHGTAYMVMDFEDGISLSKMLKQGRRFNERSLLSLVKPIAEGLDCAHRVGVLHRDIKPPNILINEDNTPVLIDFGSARFEAAEATSTKVTFHTPPYAAIEQYVKTYAQGPWTDIYALGVVLYECMTGEKPPEVLERMHGDLGKPLAKGNWPGYSQRFLEAVDAAMTIRPEERPQSITAWLEMFAAPGKRAKSSADEDDEATRFVVYDTSAEDIVPVAPPAPGFTPGEVVASQVPADPGEVEFKRAGQDTSASKKQKAAPAAEAKSDKAAKAAIVAPAKAPGDDAGSATGAAVSRIKAAAAGVNWKKPSPVAAGGGAVLLVTALVAGWAMMGSGGEEIAAADAVAQEVGPVAIQALGNGEVDGLAAAAQAMADEASEAGAPEEAVTRLTATSEALATGIQGIRALGANPGAAAARGEDMKRLAASANVDFVAALVRDAEAKAQKLSSDLPWANPLRASAANREPANRQRAAANLREALSSLRSAAQSGGAVADLAQPFRAARLALAEWQRFGAASSAAYSLRSVAEPERVETREATAAPVERRSPSPSVSTPRTTVRANGGRTETAGAGVSPAKIRQFNAIIDDARSMAKRVIRMGDDRGGSSAARDTLKANAKLARSYDSNLATLKDSMRGISSDREADRLIAQANQTKAYVQFLVKQSSDAR